MMAVPGSEDDVRQERVASFIERVRANDSALTVVSITTGARTDDWNEEELASLFTALHSNTHVTDLLLDGQNEQWSSKTRQQFAGMLGANRITKLELARCPMDGRLLADGLKQHTMFKELSLCNIKMPVKGMQLMILALLGCSELHSLTLFRQFETVPSAMPELHVLLRHSRSLLKLDLRKCGLHGEPLQRLVNILSTNEQLSLRSLDLGLNELDDDDARCVAGMLKKNRTLTTLDVARNESIGEAGWHALVDALQSNNALTALHTDGCKLADGDARIMDQLLRRNWHADVDRQRTALIENLQRNDGLTTQIDVSTDTKYESRHCRIACPWKFRQLSSLFNALHCNTHVTTFKLDKQTALESDEMMQEFARMLAVNRSITDIELRDIFVNGSTLAEGLKQHPTLKCMTLYKLCLGGMGAILAALLECSELHTLDVAFKHAHFPHDMSNLYTLLHRSCSLHRLHLQHYELSGEPLRRLADALSVNEHLRSLVLSSSGLEGDDACRLADMLKQNRILTSLDLSRNDRIGEAGGRTLADALRHNRSLTKLNVRNCRISEETRRALGAFLARNQHAYRASAHCAGVASAQQFPSSPSVGSVSDVVAAVPSHSAAASVGASNALNSGSIHSPSGHDGDGWVTEPCVPTAEELRAMGASEELAAASVIPPPFSFAAAGSDGFAAVSEPCVPTAEQLRSMSASDCTAAAPVVPALAVSDSASLLDCPFLSPALPAPQATSSAAVAVNDEGWRRMPGVPTDAEQRARMDAEELLQRGDRKAEGGDRTDGDSRTEPGVPPSNVPPQAASAHAAAAPGQLAVPLQARASATASSTSAAEAALLELQAALQQQQAAQQAALRAQMAAVEAKLAALRAGKAD
jgi:Ran GTPase-activating protein (RanGAP) involved in mRNA processing and transport